MGSLVIPAHGSIYLDADCLIYSVETQPIYWPLLKPIWKAAERNEVTLITSAFALMETLVGPLKQTDNRLVWAYENLFNSTDLQVIAIE